MIKLNYHWEPKVAGRLFNHLTYPDAARRCAWMDQMAEHLPSKLNNAISTPTLNNILQKDIHKYTKLKKENNNTLIFLPIFVIFLGSSSLNIDHTIS